MRKIILLYVEAMEGMNVRNVIVAVLIDISVARGGKNHVTKHVTSENHKKEHYIGKKKSKDNHLYGKGTKREDQLI